MTTATIAPAQSSAIAVRISDDALGVSLADGREISVPLGWYPRLQHATPGGTPGLAAAGLRARYPLGRH